MKASSILCFAATKAIYLQQPHAFRAVWNVRDGLFVQPSCTVSHLASKFRITSRHRDSQRSDRFAPRAQSLGRSSDSMAGCKIELLSPENSEDIQQATNILVECFPRNGTYSWGGALNLPGEAFSSYLQNYLPTCASQKPGCLAARSPTLDGVLCLEDFCAKETKEENKGEDKDKEANQNYPGREAVEAMLNRCTDIFWNGLQQRIGSAPDRSRGTHAYFAYLAVAPRAGGRGVAGALVADGAERMRKEGFKYALAFCVSPLSKRVFLRQGFEDWGAVVYADLEVGGRHPFASIPDECTVVVRRLDAQ